MLDVNIIEPGQSTFYSPIVMVKKKDGSWRMCPDFRQLNKMTIKDKFPIHVIDDLINEFHAAKLFTKLDLC